VEAAAAEVVVAVPAAVEALAVVPVAEADVVINKKINNL
jgi:hypothetical protein